MDRIKNRKYFYVFNDREMADIIAKITREQYMAFDRADGITYSFPNTDLVLCAYKCIRETRKSLGVETK